VFQSAKRKKVRGKGVRKTLFVHSFIRKKGEDKTYFFTWSEMSD